MAFATMVAAGVYQGSRKLADVTQSSFSLVSGDEGQYGSDELLGYSRGIPSASLEITELVFARGMQSTLIDALTEKSTVTIKFLAGGKIYTSDMKVQSADFNSDSKPGTLTCRFRLEGAYPKIR